MVVMRSKTLLGLSGILLLSGCFSGPIYSSFRSEAGALSRRDGFGETTEHNLKVMTRELGYTIDLAERFDKDVPDTVNFAFNSARLDGVAQDILRIQADWIKQFPEIRFRVFGHTDKVGETAYNKSLGMKRARAVVDFLVEQGVDKSRLEAVVSEGETKPLSPTEERELKNRRAVTEVSGFVAGHPHVLDGQYAAIVYREYVASATSKSGFGTGGGAEAGGGGE
jgi:outer membrane protein OmpA-like peptidoglycan-associated protein